MDSKPVVCCCADCKGRVWTLAGLVAHFRRHGWPL